MNSGLSGLGGYIVEKVVGFFACVVRDDVVGGVRNRW
jgi:hypothetical protein